LYFSAFLPHPFRGEKIMFSTLAQFESALSGAVLFQIGWFAAFVCMGICVWVARTYLKNTPILFIAMALFACVWMLVLTAYIAPAQTQVERTLMGLSADIGNILLVYVGGLLVADVHARQAGHPLSISWLLAVPLMLFFRLAAPHAIELLGQLILGVFGSRPSLTARQAQLIVSELIVFVGFISLGLGVQAISRNSVTFKLLAFVLVAYAVLLLYRGWDQWPDRKEAESLYVVLAAASNLAITVLVSFAVVGYAHQAAQAEGLSARASAG
jgi:hypothetical protein